MTLRILVTGSRLWTDKDTITRALMEAIADYGAHLLITDRVCGYPGPAVLWHQVTVVHGAARGADTIAARQASAWGMSVEPYPVTDDDWHAPCRPECRPGHRRLGRDGRDYCPAAGNYRNARMVAFGADVTLAFPIGRSPGTRSCMRLAEAAGIPVRRYETAAVTS